MKGRLVQLLTSLGIVFNISWSLKDCDRCKFKVVRLEHPDTRIELILNEEGQHIKIGISDVGEQSKGCTFIADLMTKGDSNSTNYYQSHDNLTLQPMQGESLQFIEVPIEVPFSGTQVEMDIRLDRKHILHPWGCDKKNMVIKLYTTTQGFKAFGDIDLEGRVYVHWYGNTFKDEAVLASKKFSIAYHNHIPDKIKLFYLKEIHDSSQPQLVGRNRLGTSFVTIDASKLREDNMSYMHCEQSIPQTDLKLAFFEDIEDKNFILDLTLRDNNNTNCKQELSINLLPFLFANTNKKLAFEFQDLESLYYQSTMIVQHLGWHRISNREDELDREIFTHQIRLQNNKYAVLMNPLAPNNLAGFSKDIQIFTKSRFEHIKRQLDTLNYHAKRLGLLIDQQKDVQ